MDMFNSINYSLSVVCLCPYGFLVGKINLLYTAMMICSEPAIPDIKLKAPVQCNNYYQIDHKVYYVLRCNKINGFPRDIPMPRRNNHELFMNSSWTVHSICSWTPKDGSLTVHQLYMNIKWQNSWSVHQNKFMIYVHQL